MNTQTAYQFDWVTIEEPTTQQENAEDLSYLYEESGCGRYQVNHGTESVQSEEVQAEDEIDIPEDVTT